MAMCSMYPLPPTATKETSVACTIPLNNQVESGTELPKNTVHDLI